MRRCRPTVLALVALIGSLGGTEAILPDRTSDTALAADGDGTAISSASSDADGAATSLAGSADEASQQGGPVALQPLRQPGLIHIAKTAGSTFETPIGEHCGMHWGMHNPMVPEPNKDPPLEIPPMTELPYGGGSDFCETTVTGWGEKYGTVYAEHIPPVTWIAQYDNYDPYAWYTSLFTVVRNPFTRTVSNFKHYGGVLFNGTESARFHDYRPHVAAMTWNESQTCDPAILNEWVVRFLRGAASAVAEFEATHVLPAGEPCSSETVLGRRGAKSTSFLAQYQNIVPQWVYVTPRKGERTPDGYPTPVSVVWFEDLNASFHDYMTTLDASYFSNASSFECLYTIDTDDMQWRDAEEGTSNVPFYGEIDCSTRLLTRQLNATAVELIREIFHQDFVHFNYSLNPARAFDAPGGRLYGPRHGAARIRSDLPPPRAGRR